MRGRTILAFLAVAVLLFAYACTPATTDDAAKSDETTVKVGLVLTGALGDQSVNDQAYEGLMYAQDNYGVEVKAVECTDASMYAEAAQKFCDEGYDLVVFNAFNQEEALRTVAPAYPDVSFMILDTIVDDIANVACFTYATHEVSFLAGVLAARKSTTGVIGFIGGMEIPTIQKYQTGYEEGVAYVNATATVIAKYVGNDNNAWSDPATAKSLTLDEIANGADVCFHAAGGSGLGMIEACNEKGVYSIGVNIDQSHLAPDTVLTSALTRGDVAIEMFVKSFVDGAVLTGHTTLDCANGGVGLVESSFFTDDDKAAIQDVTDKIISGEIVVTNVMDY
jgi:basic membrane protein A